MTAPSAPMICAIRWKAVSMPLTAHPVMTGMFVPQVITALAETVNPVLPWCVMTGKHVP
jgi:hypothetical protein